MADQFAIDAPQPRLDLFLVSKLPGMSRSHLQKLIREGYVHVNAAPARPGQALYAGDLVAVTVRPASPTTLEAEDIPLRIAFEDESILVIDKPAGLVVHPGPGHSTGTLVHAILAHCPDLAGIKGTLRPGIVHRLDKDTSGLLVVAKTDSAQLSLASQIRSRSLVKGYLALVEGHLRPERGAIEAPLGRDPANKQKIAVVAGGREATTEYRVLEYLPRHTFLHVAPKTGRTHQIRVHLAAIGHPVYGDAVYGHPSLSLRRHFLHAHRLGFLHPMHGKYVEFSSPLPPELLDVLAKERRAAPQSVRETTPYRQP